MLSVGGRRQDVMSASLVNPPLHGTLHELWRGLDTGSAAELCNIRGLQ
jgi:hypothetical protein